MTLFKYRDLAERDLVTISTFPESPEELFYMGPSYQYPLTVDQMLKKLESRSSKTVFVDDNDQPIAFANLYDISHESSTCWLGNVIISKAYRGKGVATNLLDTMMSRAAEEHGIQKMKLYCHSTNTRALIFYCKNDFVPCGSKFIENHEQTKIVAIEMERKCDHF